MTEDQKLHELWDTIAGLRLRSDEVHDRMKENAEKFVKSGNVEIMKENFRLIDEQVEVSRKMLELLSDYQNMIKKSNS